MYHIIFTLEKSRNKYSRNKRVLQLFDVKNYAPLAIVDILNINLDQVIACVREQDQDQ